LDFPESDRLLFHIDEAMSWESVRNLNAMKKAFILIQNIALQANAPRDVLECINEVRDCLDEKDVANLEA
jgi:hypothetical protein